MGSADYVTYVYPRLCQRRDVLLPPGTTKIPKRSRVNTGVSHALEFVAVWRLRVAVSVGSNPHGAIYISVEWPQSCPSRRCPHIRTAGVVGCSRVCSHRRRHPRPRAPQQHDHGVGGCDARGPTTPKRSRWRRNRADADACRSAGGPTVQASFSRTHSCDLFVCCRWTRAPLNRYPWLRVLAFVTPIFALCRVPPVAAGVGRPIPGVQPVHKYVCNDIVSSPCQQARHVSPHLHARTAISAGLC